MGTIAENIESIQKEKAEAAERAGRNPEDILLCAVTKTHTAEQINEAIRAGVTDIGENEVQEILDKYDKVLAVGQMAYDWTSAETSKVKYIIDKVLSHSFGGLLSGWRRKSTEEQAQHGIVMDILVSGKRRLRRSQIRRRYGCGGNSGEGRSWKTASSIRVRGLISAIAPYAENPEEIRPYFRRMRQLYEQTCAGYQPSFHGF